LVKWETICKPKAVGGLGVVSLRTQNKALLMKNIHKFMNMEDIPWVQLIWNAHYQPYYTPHNIAPVGSFWWKDCLSLWDTYWNLATCYPGKGDTTLLWKDEWVTPILKKSLPQLFSKDQDITIEYACMISQDDIYDHFTSHCLL
jgi:hypothetical protein